MQNNNNSMNDLACLLFKLLLVMSFCVPKISNARELQKSLKIVERSKEIPANWIEMDAGKLIWKKDKIFILHKKERIFALQLGLIQTQLNAFESISRLLHQFVISQLLQGKRGLTLSESEYNALHKLINEAVEKTLKNKFKVADIYFEKFMQQKSVTNRSFYEAYILVFIDYEDWNLLKRAVKLLFNVTSNSKLKTLGKNL